MVEQDWTPSIVMQRHLQSLVSRGFMTMEELVTSCVPEDPISPASVDGYVVSFVAFYERGFGVSSNRFLHSLLQHCRLELHNLTPSKMLHIMAFMTLCEAYMGIDPHFDLCNHFFCVRRPQDPDMELAILGVMVVHINSGHAIEPYFDIPMLKSMKGWWKKWFYSRNNVDSTFPVFTGNRPIP
jgi:hypothetical protein